MAKAYYFLKIGESLTSDLLISEQGTYQNMFTEMGEENENLDKQINVSHFCILHDTLM